MLPVGVLIPTRNSMAFLPHHIETMGHWLDLAQEIIVVDSESHDGTVEFLRTKLPADKTRFFNHPPGLYQSWNFGLRQIKAQHTYVSTIGDAISREGFAHLAEVAERFSSDVVISPPDFVDEAGRPAQANHWPVHRIISYLSLQRETCLEGIVPFLIAWTFLPFAILGSSASNLYRTSVLQENPLPTDFGWNGDGAWGLVNAWKIRLVVTPRRMSFFRKHRKLYPLCEYTAVDSDRRMLCAGLASVQEALSLRPEIKAQAERLGLERFISAKELSQRWRAELMRQRYRPWPWVFNPLAWRARSRRIAAQHHCEALLKSVLVSAPAPEPSATFAVASS
jgi:glycosyltransferase involved in cell wall biosynthesis